MSDEYSRQDHLKGEDEAPRHYGQQPRPHEPEAWTQSYSATSREQSSSHQSQNIGHSMSRTSAGSSSSAGGPSTSGQSTRGSRGGGGGDSSRGRGMSRRQQMTRAEVFQTRPKELLTKQALCTPKDCESVQLQANYFKMLSSTNWCLYKYRVDYAPEIDLTRRRKALLREHKPTLGPFIFDGTVLYTSHRLPEPLELQSKMQPEDTDVQISIRFVGDMGKGDEHYIQFFNIIMRKCLEYLNLQLVGRNYFDAQNQVEVHQYKLSLWPGYETSIRQMERDILMCAEITHKVMRQQTLLDILNDCYREHGNQYQERFKAQVIGLTVLTDYNNHTYRVDDVDFDVSPRSTFSRAGVEVSYVEYYLNKYQLRIRQESQPMLLSRTKARDRRAGLSELVYLVPELCRSTGLTDDMRRDFRMMRELGTHTRLNPNGRIQRLLSFNRRLQNEPKVVQELSEWNLRLDDKLVTLPGKILKPETIHFGQRQTKTTDAQADWTRDICRNQMYTSNKLQNWCVIVPNRQARDAEAFVQSIRSCVRQMNFPISTPQVHVINDDHASTFTSTIERVLSQANPQIVMCVLPNNRADRYSAIKKKCCVDRPVPSQCILAKNLQGKGVASIATKVAVQMNCKLGGCPWTVAIPLKGLMIIGFDICRDPHVRGRDYGAMVASLDQNHTRYFSAISATTSGEELTSSLTANIIKALHKYHELNKALPSRMVIYRDGVSDGQIPFVHDHEVQYIRRKLEELYGDPSLVKMAFIIVTKRLNTRLFLRGNNPPPGTVVDDVITNPIKYDFYIVSQCVKQGTVSPTGYSVISDNVNLDAGKLQKLTYKLTHMYFNWSGTVRVPAPCRFAQKLATLVSQALHANPSPQLETVLFFL
ncbi:piwi-like protein Siwi [Venturia canescens]|uniref:piwi-like protein Siwi n=1 Tax=Venturia canescens TaxID=32260 RepID=UPI001C9CE1FB|nr:piwi-like protein Siwi [Venturia canescens]XP_043281264.1 piwi-like protein Siwi [Venturia canescens]XP_043281265.1 piwi-like protein Siwi [Venturia canescens]XP_043281266.1 piwi-like protein Siwi [Venturia canescens]